MKIAVTILTGQVIELTDIAETHTVAHIKEKLCKLAGLDIKEHFENIRLCSQVKVHTDGSQTHDPIEGVMLTNSQRLARDLPSTDLLLIPKNDFVAAAFDAYARKISATKATLITVSDEAEAEQPTTFKFG